MTDILPEENGWYHVILKSKNDPNISVEEWLQFDGKWIKDGYEDYKDYFVDKIIKEHEPRW